MEMETKVKMHTAHIIESGVEEGSRKKGHLSELNRLCM
jgi:hypothetical protein